MKHTKHKMSYIFLHAFVTEELLMSNELVEASFTSQMDPATHVPRKIRNITIKRGKYVMILVLFLI